jgi:ABC-type multidrug transport system ATPase subunit
MKLEVKNLVKKFKTTIAVNNISFEIKKNDTLGLLGPNGCGKTYIYWHDARFDHAYRAAKFL